MGEEGKATERKDRNSGAKEGKEGTHVLLSNSLQRQRHTFPVCVLPLVCDELLGDPLALVSGVDADGLEVVGFELSAGTEDALGFAVAVGVELRALMLGVSGCGADGGLVGGGSVRGGEGEGNEGDHDQIRLDLVKRDLTYISHEPPRTSRLKLAEEVLPCKRFLFLPTSHTISAHSHAG